MERPRIPHRPPPFRPGYDVARILCFLAAAALMLSVACSDRSPTGPTASPSSTTLEQEGGVRIAGPSRLTRVLPPRKPIVGSSRPLGSGSWGSPQSSELNNRLLTVTSTGATLKSECSNGVIEEPILVDSAGRFDVGGTYQVQAGPTELPRPARFVGFTNGGTMTITVIPTGNQQIVGPFTLTLGQAPRIGYCPIV